MCVNLTWFSQLPKFLCQYPHPRPQHLTVIHTHFLENPPNSTGIRFIRIGGGGKNRIPTRAHALTKTDFKIPIAFTVIENLPKNGILRRLCSFLIWKMVRKSGLFFFANIKRLWERKTTDVEKIDCFGTFFEATIF